MKITISYISEEEQEAAGVLAALLRLHPGAKVKKSTRHPPFLHIYVTVGNDTKKQDSHCI